MRLHSYLKPFLGALEACLRRVTMRALGLALQLDPAYKASVNASWQLTAFEFPEHDHHVQILAHNTQPMPVDANWSPRHAVYDTEVVTG